MPDNGIAEVSVTAVQRSMRTARRADAVGGRNDLVSPTEIRCPRTLRFEAPSRTTQLAASNLLCELVWSYGVFGRNAAPWHQPQHTSSDSEDAGALTDGEHRGRVTYTGLPIDIPNRDVAENNAAAFTPEIAVYGGRPGINNVLVSNVRCISTIAMTSERRIRPASATTMRSYSTVTFDHERHHTHDQGPDRNRYPIQICRLTCRATNTTTMVATSRWC